jgi:bacterioferritin
MAMKDLNVEKTLKLLSRIMEFELAGVVRYTHYSLMVTGPNRIPIVAFMKAQANESLLHAQQAGEILTGLGGHPTQQIAPIDESHQHNVQAILEESLAHERRALNLYKELLDVVDNCSVYLEEFARTQIAQEELHGLELRKMMRDIGVNELRPALGHGHDDDDHVSTKKRAKKHDAKNDEKRAKKHNEKNVDKREKKHEGKHAKRSDDGMVKNGVDEPALERMKREQAKPASTRREQTRVAAVKEPKAGNGRSAKPRAGSRQQRGA